MMTEILATLAQYADLTADIDGTEIYVSRVDSLDDTSEEMVSDFRQWCEEHAWAIRDCYYIGDCVVTIATDLQYDWD